MGRYTGKKCRLLSMFGLTSSFFLVELIVGHVTNSMALIADSFHMLSDIAALIIAFLSVKMAPKSWDKNTYGWARAEVLGALVNAVFLVALCFSITMESLKRFYEPEDIHDPEMVLYVGVMGLVVNLLGLCLFHEHGSGHGHSHGGHSHVHHGTHSHLTALADDNDVPPMSIEDGKASSKNNTKAKKGGGGSHMNMRGVFLHVMADALGSVVVIISAVIMWKTDWEYKYYVDPALSLIMVLLMMRSVWPLLIESALILLQTVPTHIEVDTLKVRLLENIDGILAVHDFHVWQLTGDKIIASAHIRCLSMSEYMKVAENIKEFFHHEGIHSTTIQPEFVEYNPGDADGEDCVLGCPKPPGSDEAPDCDASKCCKPNGNGSATSVVNNINTASRVGSTSAQNTPTSMKRFNGELKTPTSALKGRCADQVENVRSYKTSTPVNRQSAPNLTTTTVVDLDDFDLDDLAAQVNLSDDLGVTPIHPDDSTEDTPMFTPRSNSRIVRIISKQSNV